LGSRKHGGEGLPGFADEQERETSMRIALAHTNLTRGGGMEAHLCSKGFMRRGAARSRHGQPGLAFVEQEERKKESK